MNMTVDKLFSKNNFFAFAREAVIKQAEDLKDDARYQLIAGTFISFTSSPDEALTYLVRARELMPGKQVIYLEIAQAFLRQGDNQKAIETLKYLQEISPEHKTEVDGYIRQIQDSVI